MSTQSEKTPQVVYVVTCYQSIVGIYSSQEDAVSCQKDLIARNRPADVLCRPIIEPLKSK